MDYNDVTREPNWVSWDLTTADVGGSGRSSFIVDTNLPVGFYQVLTTDYSGSGYDRGHMCPSADRTITTADNQELFYMSNMIPQAPDNNQGVWASFESYCRTLASAGNEVLIIAGPSSFAGSTIATGVAIPGYTWKIAVVVPLGAGTALDRIDTNTRVIAIKIPNIQGVRSTPWQNFVTTVAQLESDTGYTFFTTLATNVASVLRAKVDGQSTAGSPVITSQPINQSSGLGGNAIFSVLASGNATLTYQWNKDDLPLDGQTGTTLTLGNIQLSDAGAYTATVTNSVGSVTSSSAQLIITGLPPSITTAPSNQTVSAGSSATFIVAASGSPTLTYQWRKDASPLTNGGNIAGATSPVLTINNAQAADMGSYDAVVTNSVTTTTSNAASLSVTAAGPTIVSQPAVSPTVSIGSTATLTVVAKGSAPLVYQWRKNGTDIATNATATTATLSIPNAQVSDAGTYDVTINNTVGPLVTSTTSTLAVNTSSSIVWNFGTTGALSSTPSSGLPSDVTGGTVTSNNNFGTVAAPVSTTSASNTYSGATGGGNIGAAASTGALNTAAAGSAYFEVSLTPAAGKQVNITAIKFGTRSTTTAPVSYAIYSSANGFVSPIATGANAIPNNSTWTAITPTITTQTSAIATPITLRIYGFDGTGSPSSGTINWRMDDLSITVNTVAASSQAPAVQATTPANNATNIPLNTGITVSFNQTVNFAGSWFAISSGLNGPLAATVTGGPLAYTLTPPVNYAPGDTITLTVFNSQITDAATGLLHPDIDYTMSFATSLPVPPTFTAQPVPVAATVGSPASFSTTVTGTLPLSYQWRKDGTAITANATATSSTLVLTSVQAGDAGSYDVVASNAVGTTTSNTAALVITSPPVGAIYWDFTTTTPSSGLPIDITGATIIQGNNLGTTTLLAIPTAVSNYASASAANSANMTAKVGALSQTVGGSGYFETTLTPATGKKIVITAISFGSLSTSAGPRAYQIFTSVDNYATAVGSGPMPNNNTWVLYAPLPSTITGLVDTPVTVRIYGYNGAGSTTNGTADWRIDDLRIAATAVVPLTAQETWRQGYFGISTNTGNAGDAADPDGDGLTNLLEYGLGLDPTVASTTGLPTMSTDASSWLYTYTRPASRTDLLYSVEISTDLTTWTTTGVTLTRIATGTTEIWQASYPLATPNVFFRLVVTN
jgi:DNA/RNA endonuclease G (NUC1)